jgi:DNA-binding beta-propeller fold protein YncE
MEADRGISDRGWTRWIVALTLVVLALALPGSALASGGAPSYVGQFAGPSNAGSDTFDPATGDLYVVNSGENRVGIFSGGVEIGEFGSTGSGNGQFQTPDGIVFDPVNGDVYVADQGNNRIEAFDPSGRYLFQFGTLGSGPGQFNDPVDIAVDPSSGQLYVSDLQNVRVEKFTPDGTYLGQFGGTTGTGPGQFLSTNDLAVDPSTGDVYVADYCARIEIFSSTGTYLSEFETSPAYQCPVQTTGIVTVLPPDADLPAAIAFDPSTGQLYVGVYPSGEIQIYDPSGALVTAFAGTGSGPGQLAGIANGQAFDPGSGLLYVDTSGSVDEFGPAGVGTSLTIDNVPADITTRATGASGAVVHYATPTASAPGEALTPTISCAPASGSLFSIGTTTVTCTAVDSDNAPAQIQRTFSVTVTENELAISTPADVTVPATSPQGATVRYLLPTVTDGADTNPPAPSCTPASGSTFPIGTTTVKCTASAADADNSPVSSSFAVTVTKLPSTLVVAPQLVVLPLPHGVGLFEAAATLSNNGQPVSGEAVAFSVGGTPLCSAVTGAGGVASCGLSLTGELQVLTANSYSAAFAGDATYLPSEASVQAVQLGDVARAASAGGHPATVLGARLTRGQELYAVLVPRRGGAGGLRRELRHRVTPGHYVLAVRVGHRWVRRTITVR